MFGECNYFRTILNLHLGVSLEPSWSIIRFMNWKTLRHWIQSCHYIEVQRSLIFQRGGRVEIGIQSPSSLPSPLSPTPFINNWIFHFSKQSYFDVPDFMSWDIVGRYYIWKSHLSLSQSIFQILSHGTLVSGFSSEQAGKINFLIQ